MLSSSSRSLALLTRNGRRIVSPLAITARLTVKQPSPGVISVPYRTFSAHMPCRKEQQQQQQHQGRVAVAPTTTTTTTTAPPEYIFLDTEGTFKEEREQQLGSMNIGAGDSSDRSSSTSSTSSATGNRASAFIQNVSIPLLMKLWKQYFIRYVIITSVALATLYLIWWLSNLFTSISIGGVAKWSFYTGLLMGIGLSVATRFAKKSFTISSRDVYKVALQRVLQNEQVVNKLQAPIKPGKFRAYSYLYPDLEGDAHDAPMTRKLQIWKPARMQMMFQLSGATGKQCMVCCEVSRKSGLWNLLNNRFTFHSLYVDLPDDDDHIILKGTAAGADQFRSQNIKLQ